MLFVFYGSYRICHSFLSRRVTIARIQVHNRFRVILDNCIRDGLYVDFLGRHRAARYGDAGDFRLGNGVYRSNW